jgi:predicted AlkP superfamily pyrophosphatase or phosphodiesterase
MVRPVVLLSVAGLREKDVGRMKRLQELTAGGEIADLVPSFPAVTCPVQANMTTGRPPRMHGVIGNGFYWRDRRQVEMWTAPNECIERPQLWDLLSQHDESLRSAVWFPLHARGCEADLVCTPAPIHNPDGSESLWCYTRPLEMYGELRERLGDFPLAHFWGPMANIVSTAWIAASAVYAAEKWRPSFFYIYVPHLDYAAQRTGPDSPQAEAAVDDLDQVLGRLGRQLEEVYGQRPLWLVAGEYAITPVNHVTYPNRILREAGLLAVREAEVGEELDLERSRAFAVVDHQLAHVYVADADPQVTRQVVDLFRGRPGFDDVISGVRLGEYQLDHPRSGEVVLISTPDSWQAYYWWETADFAPSYAQLVDIHRKPGYDPVELHFDAISHRIPLDPSLVKGSHGAPATDPSQHSVLVASEPGLLPGITVSDCDVFQVVLRQFGIEML